MELAVLALAAGCALLLFSDLVACKPDPSSKSGNFRNSRHRVGLNGQTRRRSDSQTCAAPGTRTINAPNTNIWSSLTDDEAASVAKWLFSQPIFNLTAFADAGEWDNSL
jgi:hypothetical protein